MQNQSFQHNVQLKDFTKVDQALNNLELLSLNFYQLCFV